MSLPQLRPPPNKAGPGTVPEGPYRVMMETTLHGKAVRSLGDLGRPALTTSERQKEAERMKTSKASMSKSDFASLLWAYGYPPLLGQDGDVLLWYITVTLDFHGGSLIACADMEWLDGWQPTEWLVAEPDEDEWSKIRAVLENEFGSLLRAWRKELDKDNSNKLTWPEWREACRRLGIHGNVVGAWRTLDKRRVGYISLKELDRPSAEVLTDFKRWSEVKFSSMHEAFRAMDADGGGSLSLAELKGAFYKYKCSTDPKLLFDVLSSNGRTVSRKDYSFLNDWASADEEAAEEFKTVIDELWKEISVAHQSRKSMRPDSASSVMSSKIHRPQCLPKTPSRFGLASPASISTCIPADFTLGTVFPVSPYSMSLRPQSSVRRKRLLRSASDSTMSSRMNPFMNSIG